MSTSPSWFDQDKFSRLVKTVGPKTVTKVLPTVLGSDPENKPLPAEGIASTARISLVSKPPSLLAEHHRALPALPRRTVPLPNVKALFPSPSPQAPPAEKPPENEAPKAETSETTPEDEPNAPTGLDGDDLTEIWHKMGMLNEELAQAIQERDQAINDAALLRQQLDKKDQAKGLPEAPMVTPEEMALVCKQRDDAMADCENMRAQLLLSRGTSKEPTASTPGKTQELTLVTGERDQARREYMDLRKQYESLKQEQAPKEETIKFRKEWEQQVEDLKQKLEERDKEIAQLKASTARSGDGDDKLKSEVASLRDQLSRAKDEASVAQRGLALSQKALQQTRDTLREATEGTSLSRHNFDNLKNECATLAQQNTVLQAQIDQLTRDLGTAKAKTSRLRTE